ncbi:MAG: GDP-L-fucose synthase [Deltaproteobacteria bacterium]|nr:GDP-L-fucose synthase [Deltaproteobacteria bacterium]
MNNVSGKKVYITGGNGFLGRHLQKRFGEAGAEVLSLPSSKCDLSNRESVDRLFSGVKPDIVVHAAGLLGGIHFSRLYPADVFLKNLQIVCNIFEMAHKYNVQKLVNIGSACVYSDTLPGPFKEEDLLKAPMHPSVQYYGFSKLALLMGGKSFKEQFDFNSIHLVLANLYGPEDKFDPELSHVVSSMIPRFYEAALKNLPEVVCWGTGKTVREFLYVADCADAVFRATESYNDVEPINVGVGHGITMKELAETIAEVSGFKGKIVWDTTKPDGAGYKVTDISKIRQAMGWEPKTPFKEGLKKTIDWFGGYYPEWVQKQKTKKEN